MVTVIGFDLARNWPFGGSGDAAPPTASETP
jgi:hypothetical protein